MLYINGMTMIIWRVMRILTHTHVIYIGMHGYMYACVCIYIYTI